MNVEILKSLAQQARDDQPYGNKLFPPSVYYRFLKRLSSYVKPEVSVELGLCGGGGSLHIALGYPAGKVIGIDKVNSWPDRIQHLQQTCSNFEFWKMDSVKAAASYTEANLPAITILFIDTIHTYERTMQEFRAWQPLLSPEAIIMLDDLFRDAMDRAWDELPGKKLRLDDLHHGGSPTDGG